MNHITLRQLRVFQSVALARNFSRAGEQVGLTQPAVSRAISELESQLGLRLLDRSTREVELTEAGTRLAQRLPRVLQDLDDVLAEVSGLASDRSGRVRVASNPTVSAHLMPACLAACRQRHPGIDVVLADGVQREVLARVRSGDVAFGVAAAPGDAADLCTEVIYTDAFMLVCPPSHRLADSAAVDWRALRGERLVLLDASSGSRELIDAALRRESVEAAEVSDFGHPSTAMQMVAAGMGVSVMPGLATPAAHAIGLRTLPLVPEVRRGIALVRRRDRDLAPLAQVVWALVEQVARQVAD